tara:strand:+ start:2803 stop:4644 length:1842 start_codon:yes stop_codon:yes gene_type:complete
MEGCIASTTAGVIIEGLITGTELITPYVQNLHVDFIDNINKVIVTRNKIFNNGFSLPQHNIDITNIDDPHTLWENICQYLDKPKVKFALLSTSLAKSAYDFRRKGKEKKKRKEEKKKRQKAKDDFDKRLIKMGSATISAMESKDRKNKLDRKLELQIQKKDLIAFSRKLNKINTLMIFDTMRDTKIIKNDIKQLKEDASKALQAVNTINETTQNIEKNVAEARSDIKDIGKKVDDLDSGLEERMEKIMAEKSAETYKALQKNADDTQLATERANASYFKVVVGDYLPVYLEKYKSIFIGCVTDITHQGAIISFQSQSFPLHYHYFNHLYSNTQYTEQITVGNEETPVVDNEATPVVDNEETPVVNEETPVIKKIYFQLPLVMRASLFNTKHADENGYDDVKINAYYRSLWNGLHNQHENINATVPDNITLTFQRTNAINVANLVKRGHEYLITDDNRNNNLASCWNVFKESRINKDYLPHLKKPTWLLKVIEKQNDNNMALWLLKEHLSSCYNKNQTSNTDILSKYLDHFISIMKTFGSDKTFEGKNSITWNYGGGRELHEAAVERERQLQEEEERERRYRRERAEEERRRERRRERERRRRAEEANKWCTIS